MKDVSGVMKVVERIDSDVKETNIRIDRRTRELKQLESRFENLADRLAFLEQANIEKEGQIDYLEGVIQSMSDKLCRCRDREVSSVSVEAGTEELMVEEAEGSQLEYTKDDEYHTPEVEEVPLPVRELRLIESPSLEPSTNFSGGDECCRPRHPGIGWRSAGPSPAPSEDESPMENIVPIPIQIQRSALVNPVRGQRAVRSAGPIRSKPTIFHARHPYKPSGDHQGISLPISKLRKRYFWRRWARSPGNPYGRFVKGSSDSEGSATDAAGERGEDEGDRVVRSSGSGGQVD